MRVEHVDNRMPLPEDVYEDKGNLLLLKDGPLQQYGHYGAKELSPEQQYSAINTLGGQMLDVIVRSTPDDL